METRDGSFEYEDVLNRIGLVADWTHKELKKNKPTPAPIAYFESTKESEREKVEKEAKVACEKAEKYVNEGKVWEAMKWEKECTVALAKLAGMDHP